MRIACFVVLLLAAGAAETSEPVNTSIARPYYECIRSSAVRYAKKAEEIAAVIQAAEASCQEKRNDLLAEIIANIIIRESPGDAEDGGKRILSHLESEWRPHVVLAILEAR